MEHLKHMMGPVWWLALSFRHRIHQSPRDPQPGAASRREHDRHHKAAAFSCGHIPVVPAFSYGVIVCLVQTVFCLLSAVYIGMAIEHHDKRRPLRRRLELI